MPAIREPRVDGGLQLPPVVVSSKIRSLENRRRFTPTKGSNPFPSAILGILSQVDSTPWVPGGSSQARQQRVSVTP